MAETLPIFPDHEFWTGPRVERFCRVAVPIEYRSGAFILSPEDPPKALFLIESGKVSMYHYSIKGDIVTFDKAKPGDLLGTKGVFIKPERLFYTIADSDVRVWKISHEDFLTLLREDFEFAVWQFSRAFSRLDLLERKMLNSVLLSAHHRIVLALLELSDQSEQKTEHSAVIFITQQEISSMLSVTRQTTGACLKDLQDKGILKTKRGQIEICDLAALRREVL